MMRRQTLRFSIVVVGLILFTTFSVLLMGVLNPQQVNAGGKCTVNTLKGTYIFEARGVVVDQQGEVVPYAEAGTGTFDGQGKSVAILSTSTNGVSSLSREVLNVTYELKSASDCIYFLSVDNIPGLELDLYTTPAGRRITYLSPGFSGTMVKP